MAAESSQLRVAHELALAMPEAADLGDLQERLLRLITVELGYERAMLATVDPDEAALSGWLCSTSGPGGHLQRMPHAERLPLGEPAWPIAAALAEGRARLLAAGTPPTADGRINRLLGLGCSALLPMVLRGRPLGLLLVDNPLSGRPLGPADLTLLAELAEQASVMLGGLRLMLERAGRLAVEEERARVAMELHDSIAQQLYGIAYTLDGCLRLLPGQPEQAAAQLRYLQPQARQAIAALRRAIFDIWPSALDAERCAAELRSYLAEIAPQGPPQLFLQIDRGFDGLPEPTRRQLYRIAQEALNNIVRHAGARRAKLTLLVRRDEAILRIADDGCGFDPRALPPPGAGAGLGLPGIRGRAGALGGSLRLDSAPGQGTTITLSVPLPAEAPR